MRVVGRKWTRMNEDKVNRPKHYNINWKGEQAIETYTYIRSWKMDYPESNIIKYVTRHPYKGKSLQDLSLDTVNKFLKDSRDSKYKI